MNFRCYYFAAGSYILTLKDVLLELLTLIEEEMNSYTIAEWKYTDLFCFGQYPGNLRTSAVLLKFANCFEDFIYFCTSLNIVV